MSSSLTLFLMVVATVPVGVLGGLVGFNCAMTRLRFGVVPARAPHHTTSDARPAPSNPGVQPVRTFLMAASGPPRHDPRPPSRPYRVPFAPGDPLSKYRAVTGSGARVRWWQKVMSLLTLAAMVVLLGALLAAVMGLIVIGARILLDVLVS